MMLLEIKKKDEEDVQGRGMVLLLNQNVLLVLAGKRGFTLLSLHSIVVGYLIIIINLSSDHVLLLL